MNLALKKWKTCFRKFLISLFIILSKYYITRGYFVVNIMINWNENKTKIKWNKQEIKIKLIFSGWWNPSCCWIDASAIKTQI